MIPRQPISDALAARIDAQVEAMRRAALRECFKLECLALLAARRHRVDPATGRIVPRDGAAR
jgi:hypothetical protein